MTVLQVLVGGFIKLSAAGRKSDEYSRFRLGSNSPALAITRWIHHRKAGTVASGAPTSGTSLFSLAQNFCFCLENLGSSKESGEEIVDPKPTCTTYFKDTFLEA